MIAVSSQSPELNEETIIMPLESELENLASTFYDEGYSFDAGCNEEHIERYVAMCRELMPYKKLCIVRNWQWWDLTLSDHYKKLFAQNGQIPALIKADNVIEDEAGRFPNGGWVRTSPLVRFTEDCIFETKNTLYLLVGNGSRKTVSLSAAVAFF